MRVRYVLNYAWQESGYPVPADCKELLSGNIYRKDDVLTVPGWGVAVLEYPEDWALNG